MTVRRLALSALLLASAWTLAAGCSKGTKSTNPAVLPPELGGTLAPGAIYAHRFFTSGAYAYHCSIHPSMTGIVVVTPAAPASDSLMGVNITSYAFTQSSVSIPVNGKVTWTNFATITHTVTSD
jgi:plastocyanin